MTDTTDERRQRALNRGMGAAIDMPWQALNERMAAFKAAMNAALDDADTHYRAQAVTPELRERMAELVYNAGAPAGFNAWMVASSGQREAMYRALDEALRHIRAPMLRAALRAAPRPPDPRAEDVARLSPKTMDDLAQTIREQSRRAEDVARLVAAAKAARYKFVFYATEHARAAEHDKAATNQEMADTLGQALAPFRNPQQEGEKSAGAASAAPAAATDLGLVLSCGDCGADTQAKVDACQRRNCDAPTRAALASFDPPQQEDEKSSGAGKRPMTARLTAAEIDGMIRNHRRSADMPNMLGEPQVRHDLAVADALTQLRAEIARLREALAPFAAEGRKWAATHGHDDLKLIVAEDWHIADRIAREAEFTVGDLKRAAASWAVGGQLPEDPPDAC